MGITIDKMYFINEINENIGQCQQDKNSVETSVKNYYFMDEASRIGRICENKYEFKSGIKLEVVEQEEYCCKYEDIDELAKRMGSVKERPGYTLVFASCDASFMRNKDQYITFFPGENQKNTEEDVKAYGEINILMESAGLVCVYNENFPDKDNNIEDILHGYLILLNQYIYSNRVLSEIAIKNDTLDGKIYNYPRNYKEASSFDMKVNRFVCTQYLFNLECTNWLVRKIYKDCMEELKIEKTVGKVTFGIDNMQMNISNGLNTIKNGILAVFAVLSAIAAVKEIFF